MRLLTLLLVTTTLVLSGCGKQEPIIVTGEALVPFPEILSSSSAQERRLPWSANQVLIRKPVTFPTNLPDTTPEGDSPGLAAGSLWLEARQAARVDLGKQIMNLPAAEPPPGETEVLTIGQFIQRRPSLEETLLAIIDQVDQHQVVDATGGGGLTMTLQLAPVAEAVLNVGGGFSERSAIGQEARPKNIARNEALALSREELNRAVTTYNFTEENQIYQWVPLDPVNVRILEHVLKDPSDQTLTLSEESITEAGKPAWKATRELDITLLVERAREDMKEELKRERQAEKARATREKETTKTKEAQ